MGTEDGVQTVKHLRLMAENLLREWRALMSHTRGQRPRLVAPEEYRELEDRIRAQFKERLSPASLMRAKYIVAREYGFGSWSEMLNATEEERLLVVHVES